MNTSIATENESKKNLQMIVFISREEHLKGKRLIQESQELKTIPCVDFLSFLVVSIETISLLKANGLKFQTWESVSESNLTKRQTELLEKKRAFLVEANYYGTFFVECTPPTFVSNGRHHYEKI